MDAQRIDAHQHFWQYDPVRDAWIDDSMKVIQRDFMPDDLEPVLQQNGIDGCVAVQADQSETETLFLLELAEKHPFIKGVVGWIDLRSKDLEKRLEHFSDYPLLKGFRHILQGEAPEFMLQPDFLKGLSMIEKKGFTYDILVFPNHLKAVEKLLQQHENQHFIIDHLAKPHIKKGMLDEWADDMKTIASYPNVYCKLSGMVTEADWQNWRPEQLFPYLETALELFGPHRLCYGSDWPVCLLAAGYEQQLQVVTHFIQTLSPNERSAIMGGNAATFYRL